MLAKTITEKLRKTRWLLNIGDDDMAEPIAIIAAELKPVRELAKSIMLVPTDPSPQDDVMCFMEVSLRQAIILGSKLLALIDGSDQPRS